VQYRSSCGSKAYTKWMRRFGYKFGKDDVNVIASQMIADLVERHKYFHFSLSPNNHRQYAESVWEPDPGMNLLEYVLIIPIDSIDERRMKLLQLEEARRFAPEDGIRKITRRSRRRRIVKLTSPPVPEENNVVYSFDMIMVRNKVYFTCPWPTTDRDLFYPTKSSYERTNSSDVSYTKRHRKGVFYAKNEDRFYFTFDFLLNGLSSNPLNRLYSLQNWLRDYATLPAAKFEQLFDDYYKQRVDPEDRKDGTIHRYRESEDEVIARLYRPGMSKADKQEIMESCPGRSWQAIRVRANVLCEKLIATGVHDIKLLPHLNRSPKLLEKIRLARKLREEM